MPKPDPKQIFDLEKLRATKPAKTPEQIEEEAKQQKEEKKDEQ